MEAPNTSGISCSTCRAYHPQSETGGLCRAHSPQCNALIVMTKSITAAGLVPQMQVVSAWPTVKPHEGCLEYEPAPSGILAS